MTARQYPATHGTTTLEEALAARLAAEARLEEGWAGTVLVEPLTALAGGILGGTLVAALAWRAAWRTGTRRGTLLTLDRRLRRSLRPRPPFYG